MMFSKLFKNRLFFQALGRVVLESSLVTFECFVLPVGHDFFFTFLFVSHPESSGGQALKLDSKKIRVNFFPNVTVHSFLCISSFFSYNHGNQQQN